MTGRALMGVGYLIAAIACLVASFGSARQMPASLAGHGRRSVFWYLAAVFLGVMGVARAADLAGAAGGVTRRFVQAERWYQERRPAQQFAVVALLALLVAVGLFAMRHRRDGGRPAESSVTLFVLMYLAGLGAVRTVSFHHSDLVLTGTRLLGTTVGNLLELAGLGFVIVLSLRAAAASRSGPAPAGRDTVAQACRTLGLASAGPRAERHLPRLDQHARSPTSPRSTEPTGGAPPAARSQNANKRC